MREGRGADGRGRAVSGQEWRAVWAAWAGKRGEGGGRARAGLEVGPAARGERDFLFLFLFYFFFFFFSTFVSFVSFSLNKNSLNELGDKYSLCEVLQIILSACKGLGDLGVGLREKNKTKGRI